MLRTYSPKKTESSSIEVAVLVDMMAASATEGVPYQLAESLRNIMNFPKTTYASRLLDIDPRTYRRFESRGLLSPLASDRAYRLGRLLEEATKLHGGDEEAAKDWLLTPNLALGGARPIDAVRSQPEFDRTIDIIKALDEGAFV